MSRFHAATFLRTSLGRLAIELRSLFRRGPRMVLAAQTVGSVLLAVTLANLLHLEERWWVAISAYVVMRADWSTSWKRAAQRMAGTVGGAAAAVLAATLAGGNVWLQALALALAAGAGVYRTLGSTRSYGWLLATITAVLILAEAPHGQALWLLAGERVLDVAVGTAACVAVAGLVHLVRPALDLPLLASVPTAKAPDPHSSDARRARRWQSLPVAFSVGLLSMLHGAVPLPAYLETLVTLIVLPVIPLATLMQRDQSEAAVALRMANRVLGCLLAAVAALALLPWAGGQPQLYLPALGLGVWLASHVQSGHEAASYVGLQFGIAYIMAFVQDRAWTGHLSPALVRLAGILAGVALLAILRLLFARLRASFEQRA